jgi:hypothetical protein
MASGEPIQTIDSAGNVRAMSRAEYEQLHDSDPRLHLAVVGEGRAWMKSLRVRGIETGFEVRRERN